MYAQVEKTKREKNSEISNDFNTNSKKINNSQKFNYTIEKKQVKEKNIVLQKQCVQLESGSDFSEDDFDIVEDIGEELDFVALGREMRARAKTRAIELLNAIQQTLERIVEDGNIEYYSTIKLQMIKDIKTNLQYLDEEKTEKQQGLVKLIRILEFKANSDLNDIIIQLKKKILEKDKKGFEQLSSTMQKHIEISLQCLSKERADQLRAKITGLHREELLIVPEDSDFGQAAPPPAVVAAGPASRPKRSSATTAEPAPASLVAAGSSGSVNSLSVDEIGFTQATISPTFTDIPHGVAPRLANIYASAAQVDKSQPTVLPGWLQNISVFSIRNPISGEERVFSLDNRRLMVLKQSKFVNSSQVPIVIVNWEKIDTVLLQLFKFTNNVPWGNAEVTSQPTEQQRQIAQTGNLLGDFVRDLFENGFIDEQHTVIKSPTSDFCSKWSFNLYVRQ